MQLDLDKRFLRNDFINYNMVTAITYICSGYSSNMEVLRAQLAFLIHLEEARQGAEVWLEPSLYRCFTLEL